MAIPARTRAFARPHPSAASFAIPAKPGKLPAFPKSKGHPMNNSLSDNFQRALRFTLKSGNICHILLIAAISL